MGIEVVLPGGDYLSSRRWARYQVEVPVWVMVEVGGEATVVEGRGSQLNCGGMTVFAPIELAIGEQVSVEFTPPYSSRPLTMTCVVRNCHRYSYGVEFVTQRKVA
ncbi:MAG: PilZ domain-containing protein [Candidatus Korobacteraceae bacterium]|jgi:hypothetical protein